MKRLLNVCSKIALSHCISSCRRLLAAALIEASGVRRSCDTEERSAVRRASVRRRTSTCILCWRRYACSIIVAAWSRKVQKKAVREFVRPFSMSRCASVESQREFPSTWRRSTPTPFCPTLSGSRWSERRAPGSAAVPGTGMRRV